MFCRSLQNRRKWSMKGQFDVISQFAKPSIDIRSWIAIGKVATTTEDFSQRFSPYNLSLFNISNKHYKTNFGRIKTATDTPLIGQLTHFTHNQTIRKLAAAIQRAYIHTHTQSFSHGRIKREITSFCEITFAKDARAIARWDHVRHTERL